MMKASLDTNVIIHLYRAGKQQVLFNRFPDGVYMYGAIVSEHLGFDKRCNCD